MSNDPESPLNERVLTDQQARKLLERAIQLDARRAGDTTLAELRKVAQELNISPAAFSDALRELETKAVTTNPPAAAPVAASAPPELSKADRGSWWRKLAIGAAAFLAAALTGRNAEEPAIVVLTVAALILMLHHRRRKTPGEFQQELLALFAPFSLGWFAAHGPREIEFIYALALGW